MRAEAYLAQGCFLNYLWSHYCIHDTWIVFLSRLWQVLIFILDELPQWTFHLFCPPFTLLFLFINCGLTQESFLKKVFFNKNFPHVSGK